MPAIPVFDGHNDLVSRLYLDSSIDFLSDSAGLHISRPALDAGGMFGGLFAMFVPPRDQRHTADGVAPPVSLARARSVVTQQLATLLRLVERPEARMRVCRTTTEITNAHRDGVTAVVVHLEGAEAIGPGLEELDVLYAAGLRSLGPVWSRHNRFGRGVPIYRGGTPDTGAGLTAAGRRLVRRCFDLGVMVDLSHITEAGFWDVARLDQGPLVASHSNAWELCNSPRNLTDEQLRAIRRSRGIVGLNLATIFLRRDRQMREDTPLSVVVDHLRYLADRVGVEHLALGSDFDGAQVPAEIGSAAGLPRLFEALQRAGFTREECEGVAWRNWKALLSRVWR